MVQAQGLSSYGKRWPVAVMVLFTVMVLQVLVAPLSIPIFMMEDPSGQVPVIRTSMRMQAVLQGWLTVSSLISLVPLVRRRRWIWSFSVAGAGTWAWGMLGMAWVMLIMLPPQDIMLLGPLILARGVFLLLAAAGIWLAVGLVNCRTWFGVETERPLDLVWTGARWAVLLGAVIQGAAFGAVAWVYLEKFVRPGLVR